MPAPSATLSRRSHCRDMLPEVQDRRVTPPRFQPGRSGVNRRHSENVIVGGAVAGNVRPPCPNAHERDLGLIGERNNRKRDRCVEPAEQHRYLLALNKLASGQQSLARITLIIASDKLDLPTVDAACSIALVDRRTQAANNSFPRLCRLARKGSDKSDFDGFPAPEQH